MSISTIMAALCAAFFLIISSTNVGAQGFDPSDIWFKAYLDMKDGEQMEEQNNLLGAYNNYVESKKLLDAVYREHPDFHPGIVRFRRKFLADRITELKASMADQNRPRYVGNAATPSATAPAQVTPDGLELPSRAAAPQAPIGTSPEFSAPLQPLPSAGSTAQPTPGAVTGPTPGSDNPFVALQQQYQQMKSQVDELNRQNNDLQRRLTAREQQLINFQNELTKARDDEKTLRDQVAQNSGASPETMRELKAQLADAMSLAKQANNRSDSLLAELKTSRRDYAKLQAERDKILRERDQLAAVVDQDAGKKQLTDLMKENERLRGELEDTRTLAENLRKESGDKDAELTILKEKLANIEKQRTQLLADNALHRKHISELQQHLKDLGKESLAGPPIELASADPSTIRAAQENGLLRDIVLRQLSRQNQLKQAKQALIEQLEDLGVESASLLASIDDIVDGAKLTTQEKDMIRNPDFDDSTGPMQATIIVEGAEPDGSGDGIITVQSMEEELNQVQKAARLDFNEGRLDEAEAGYKEYLRMQPQSVEGNCNLAQVYLRLERAVDAQALLEKAIALDHDNGRPHYLLGVLFFREGKMDDALGQLELGIARDPDNARAHNYVGVICSQKDLTKRAEDSFTQATTLDPKFADPHFNLAVLYATGETPDVKKVRTHYSKALDLGAERDNSIETFLDTNADVGATTTASAY